MATVTVTELRIQPGSVLLDGVTWDEYEAQLRIIGNRHIRVNYDDGWMEIMSPLRRHGSSSLFLGRMVDVLAEELDIPYSGADPVTLKRLDLAKGIEPDRLCHVGDHVAMVSGPREFDFTVDPPPDLIIEVDATSSSIPRMPIFAALGIPEVWRVADGVLHFLRLQPDGTYRDFDRGLAFPVLSLAEAARFLEKGQRSANEAAWLREFRAFARDVLVPRLEGER